MTGGFDCRGCDFHCECLGRVLFIVLFTHLFTYLFTPLLGGLLQPGVDGRLKSGDVTGFRRLTRGLASVFTACPEWRTLGGYGPRLRTGGVGCALFARDSASKRKSEEIRERFRAAKEKTRLRTTGLERNYLGERAGSSRFSVARVASMQ